jgi:hypothetical protein
MITDHQVSDFDLCDMADPASIYSIAGITLRVHDACRHPHHLKVGTLKQEDFLCLWGRRVVVAVAVAAVAVVAMVVNDNRICWDPHLMFLIFFILFSIFWKNKSRLMQSLSYLCVFVSPTISFWMPEPIFMKCGMYVMAPESISVVYFINPSYQSVCLYVYPSNHC